MPSWDDSANQYDAFEKKWHHYEKIADGLVKLVELHDTSKVLDLACGTGACTQMLGRISTRGKIVGIDQSGRMIELAKETMIERGISNVTFVCGDVSELSNLLREDQFDVAVCNSAFWQFPEPRKVLKELHALLKVGGQLGFNLPRWFPSDEARELFRMRVREILAERGLPPLGPGSLRNQTIDYAETLSESGFRSIKDVEYESQVPEKMIKDWRAIPVFSDLFRSPRLPQEVSNEIRSEFEKVRDKPREGERVSRWKIITAKNA